jgi:hypothetical protein
MKFKLSNAYCQYCFLLLTGLITFLPQSFSQKNKKQAKQEFQQIKVYHFANASQETVLDNYLKTAYLPALHKAGIKQVGIFKHLGNDTAKDKKIYIFFSAGSLEKIASLPDQLQKDDAYTTAAQEYMNAASNNSSFTRFETILLKAFPLAPQMQLPNLKADRKERVYELRSYEGATEKLYKSKVKMFNEGGEISLFQRLNFNAVFYAEVVSGNRMPNLMYMTTFENMPARDTLWKAFFADPQWKTLSAIPEYQRNVSRSEIIFLRPTDYSDF